MARAMTIAATPASTRTRAPSTTICTLFHSLPMDAMPAAPAWNSGPTRTVALQAFRFQADRRAGGGPMGSSL
jgi:hypothetical protein